MSFFKKIYGSSPYFIQNISKRAYSIFKEPIWKNPEFLKWYNFLQESQWWSKEKLEEYQMQQLSRLLYHAYENVAYYRKVFNERGLRPKDIQNFDDLRKLPYLTKEIVRRKLPYLTAQNYPKSRLQYVTTGGSTATPLGFYQEKDITDIQAWAFLLSLWSRVNFKPGDRSVILRGNVVKLANKGKLWEYNPITKNLILSSYHMTDKTLPKYIEKIREFKPDFVQTYPSVITILARFMKENHIEPFSSVKALLCGSENLYSPQRELLEQTFQCRVYSFYGHSEKTVLAGECEKSIYYHILLEYGIVELINKNGENVSRENELGEIVTTGFTNFACPFIRYRSMDTATSLNIKCKCGRNYLLLKDIKGRVQEFIVANDGSLISLGPVIFGIHEAGWSRVKQIQFLQEKSGELIVKVVKGHIVPDTEIDAYIRGLLKARIEGRCKLYIKFVDYIPRTKSGKYKFLIQKLPIKFGQ